VLLRNGRLIDIRREHVAPDADVMPPTTLAQVADLRKYDSTQIKKCTAGFSDLVVGGGLSVVSGFAEYAVAGIANEAEQMPSGPMSWSHGFQLRLVTVDPGARTAPHLRAEEEVLLMHEGELHVTWASGSVSLRAGDVLTVPPGVPRSFANESASPATVHVVRGGDHPAGIQWRP